MNLEDARERMGGEDKAQDIFDYLDTFNEPAKWSGDQLMEMRKEFNKKIRELV